VEVPTIESLLTTGGLGVVVLVVTQLIFGAWRPSGETKDRFGPLIAVAVGIATSLLATVVLGLVGSQDIFNAVLAGLFAGFTGMGLHDGIDSAAPGVV